MSELVNNLVKDISNLKTGSVKYDLQIVTGQSPDTKTFEAHSLILCARSPYFNAALSSLQPKEANGMMVFNKHNIAPNVFSIILEYVVSGGGPSTTSEREKKLISQHFQT